MYTGYTGNLVWLPPIVPMRVPERKRGQEETEELCTEIDRYSSSSEEVGLDPRKTKRQRIDARRLRKTTLRGNLLSGASTLNHLSKSSPTTTEKPFQLSNTSAAVETSRDNLTLSASIHHRPFKRKRDSIEDEDFDVQFMKLFGQARTMYPSVTSVAGPVTSDFVMISRVFPEDYLEQTSPLSSSLGSAMGYSGQDNTSVSSYTYDPEVGLSKVLKRKRGMEVTDDPRPSSREPPAKRRGGRTKMRSEDMLQALSTNVPGSSKLASNFPFPSQVVRTDGEFSETTLPWTTLAERDDLPTIRPSPPDMSEDTGLGSYTAVASQTEAQHQDSVIAPTLAETQREKDLSDLSLEGSHWKERLDDVFEEPTIDIGCHEGVSEEDFSRFLEDLGMYSSWQVLFPGVGF
ncbi:hypothetical protein C0993_006183 [Termitomyces sp. T159_Od127]|nr:hypothetical protein C0993_006183 [Termitomyces sp. T159_Od127]